MEQQAKYLKELINAFKSRNEKLTEEIQNNNDAIKSLNEELERINEESGVDALKVA